jgi:D-alanine-D-alanine ligase
MMRSEHEVLQGKLVVLMGGPGSERVVSLRSAEAVAKALRDAGADVEMIDVTGPDFEIPTDTRIAVNMIHGTFGEDGQIQEILDGRGVKYTGEGAAGSRVAFDKILSKERFVAGTIPTPVYEVLHNGDRPSFSPPLVVKAPSQGSSVGVYIVKNDSDLDPAVNDAHGYSKTLLIEKFVKGRELTVGILGQRPLPVVEIVTKDGVYDFRNKYPWANTGGSSSHFCPAPLSPEETKLVQDAAVAAHRALGLEVYSRVDVMLTDDGHPIVLEVNTIPGMTETSLLPDAARAEGMEFPALCAEIIRLSLQRYERQ